MKSTTLPPIRVAQKVRKKLEAALEDGETLSSFILAAATTEAEVRQAQRLFIAKGLARSKETARTGKYVSGEVVFSRLEQILGQAKRRASTR